MRIIPSLQISQPLLSPFLGSIEIRQRFVSIISGALVELVSEPNQRIPQVLSLFFESRALFIIAERRIPDILAAAGDEGVHITLLAAQTGIEARKLSTHVFSEVAENRFANNRISAALVNNEGLRAYVQLFNLHIYCASEYLPNYLLGDDGASYDVAKTALQESLGIDVPLWEWMAKRIPLDKIHGDGPGYPSVPDVNNCHLPLDEQGLVLRPELENFALAMAGGGNASSAAHAFDFPWVDLGEGLVVDVGGGVGGFLLQLLPVYPKLRFIVQDREENVRKGETEVFPCEAPNAVASGRVTFQTHDFFQENPVKNADVYWLRGILHDWSDEYCVQILKAIKPAMRPDSKILVCDPVMNTTFGCSEIAPAPSPLLANYGYYVRYCHNRDLGLMSTINGIERTPAEFKELIEMAGLKLIKFWPVRSMVGITEIGL